jgi:hypothetical protein
MSGKDDAQRDTGDSTTDSGPSLEAPSLFGRKRRRKPAAPAPDPVADRVAEPLTEPLTEPVAEPVVEPVVRRRPEPERATEATVEVTRPVAARTIEEPTPAADPAEQEASAQPAAPRRSLQLPQVPGLTGRAGVAVVGVVVGLLVVVATLATQGLCSVVRGTSSCGGGGFFLLVAILVVAAVVGGALLRAVGEPEPGSTALLAVALLSVVTLLFLAGQLFEWWMAIAIPLVSLAMFLVSHWVTTTFADSPDGA